MMMQGNFATTLERQEQGRVAVISERGETTLSELLSVARDRRNEVREGKSGMVVRCETVEDFVSDLLAFDGHVESLLLQPRDAPASLDLDGTRSDGIVTEPPRAATRWIIGTSGTTGAPKLIPHTFRSLTSTTKTDLSVGMRHRWGLMYDPARFAGLQVVLQALLSGGVLLAPGLRVDTEQMLEFLEVHGVTAVSATPSLWRRILMSSAARRLQLRQITLGGEIADQTILAALRKAFPAARVVHIFASTEAGVGFSVGDGKEGFPISYLRDGALSGVQLRVSSDNHLLIRRIPSGRESVGGEFVDTEDVVQVQEQRVRFLGRASGAINVGGNKVAPEKVEAILRRHPRVVAARVFGQRSSVMGSLVLAEVELDSPVNHELVIKELDAACRTQLERWECPVSVRVVDKLALGASGKLSRVPGDG